MNSMFWQLVIFLGVIASLLIVGSIYFRNITIKHKKEKKRINSQRELELKKVKELIEIKNKELATAALQLAEKTEYLKSLKNKLKNLSQGNNVINVEIKKILNSIPINNDQSWEEFKLRFTTINDKFYEKLIIDYPMLTQGDQKICALIKLNFSSKDMSRILGISVASVHTTRYRLRKKMGLQRSINLEDFIATL